MTILAMIPARMGSQRLTRKNLRELGGVPLITRAIRRCLRANIFDAVWVNSESDLFADIAKTEGVFFHKRPLELGSHTATSEEFVLEFLRGHECDYLVQVHSIAPLLTVAQIQSFTARLSSGEFDVLLSFVPEQIECALAGQPVNFSFGSKTNSQDLEPLQRISWSITAWRRTAYLEAAASGRCATYTGRKAFFALDFMAGHVIKTEEDFRIAEALLPIRLQEDANCV